MKRLLLKVIGLYQYLSYSGLPCCRYYPSCSDYANIAIRKNSLVKALFYIGGRLLRCSPWSRGGIDFPPNSNIEV